MKKRYFLIFVSLAVLGAILGFAYSFFILNRQQSMVIEFNYPGAEKGLNPDGSVFEISELKSPEVIELAKYNLRYSNVETGFLRSRIFITSKVSDQSIDRIISDVQNEKSTVYMSTTFHVYYSQKDKFSKNESAVFMESLAKAYTEYFTEKYSEKNDILIFNAEDYDFDNIDYIEAHRILKNKVESMLSFIKAHQSENRAFYSEDKENLGMAAQRLKSFLDTSLEKYYAFVVQNSVSKKNVEYVKALDYLIDDNNLDYRKKIEGSDIVRDIIKEYEPSIAAVAFIPSVDSKHNFYMSRTKTGIDDLTKMSFNDGIASSNVLKDIEYYKDLKDKFSLVTTSPKSNREIADDMLVKMSATLEDISAEVLKVDSEYIEHKTMNYFSIRLPEKYNSISFSMILKTMLLGAAIAIVVILFSEFMLIRFKKKAKVIKDSIVVAEHAVMGTRHKKADGKHSAKEAKKTERRDG
ncbi:MAG: hypothetical protein IJQ80_08440 [Clostridia bacterium]|nr:hypothetical protein [Clostridia bacterium]